MIKPAVVVTTKQLHQFVSKRHEDNMLFYEYEIVDKAKETKWVKREAKNKGLCLFSGWLFIFIGNAVLIAITCTICAILLFINSAASNNVTVTTNGNTYGNTCVAGSNDCDSSHYLVCTTGTCTCYSNRVWDGTDCACSANQYWDGVAW